MHNAKSFEVKGKWSRWSSYSVVNGVIVPAENASLIEYDPWETFRANEGKYRTVEQPYKSFLRLRQALDAAAKKGAQPTAVIRDSSASRIGPQNDADQLILDWCNQYGLLGILPTMSNSIYFPWNPPGVPTSSWRHAVHHRRYGGWWTSSSHSWDNSVNDLPFVPKNPTESRVTWLNSFMSVHAEFPLSLVADFLPQNSAWLPVPLSPPFWQAYREPCELIGQYCADFARSVEEVSEWSGGLRGKPETQRVIALHDHLSALAQAVAPAFILNAERNAVEEIRVSPGLLASYALMFLWDRTEGRRALRCRNCCDVFVSDDPRAGYCSARCRNTAQSRRYRESKRAPVRRDDQPVVRLIGRTESKLGAR